MRLREIINKIICGDCVEILKIFPDNSIDMTLTSPPYDRLRSYDDIDQFTFEKFKEVAKQLFRITKKGGVVVWVVGDATVNGSETGTSFKQVLYFKEVGFRLHDTMIYAKKGITYPSNNRYYQVFEYMFILSKGKPKTVNLIRDRKNKTAGEKAHWGKITYRQHDGSLKENGKNYIVPKYSIRTNIWIFSIGRGNSTRDDVAYGHPAIFPEKLAQGHILSWTKEGDIVLDPMCGSGTTLKMAKLNNRRFIGIDINTDYCKIATTRLELEKSENIRIKTESKQRFVCINDGQCNLKSEDGFCTSKMFTDCQYRVKYDGE